MSRDEQPDVGHTSDTTGSTSKWQGASVLVDDAMVGRIGAWYVAEMRLRVMSKWIGAIIAASVLNPVMYLAAIGVGVGTLVDANTEGAGVQGVSYLVFLAPALLAAAAIQGAIDESMFPTLDGFKWNRGFFGMHSTPLTSRHIVNGVLIAAIIRTVLAATAYWVVLLFFGALPLGRAWLLIPLSVLAGAAFAAAMVAVTSYITEDDGYFVLVDRFIVVPLFLFSGTFYPLSSMPSFLQPIGWVSPLWHATEAGRFIAYGHSVSPAMMVVHLGFLAMVLALGLLVAYRRFERKLTR
jgi:lipooligosaccharide transport system permease protein